MKSIFIMTVTWRNQKIFKFWCIFYEHNKMNNKISTFNCANMLCLNKTIKVSFPCTFCALWYASLQTYGCCHVYFCSNRLLYLSIWSKNIHRYRHKFYCDCLFILFCHTVLPGSSITHGSWPGLITKRTSLLIERVGMDPNISLMWHVKAKLKIRTTADLLIHHSV